MKLLESGVLKLRKSAIYIIAVVSVFSIFLAYNYYFEKKDSIQEDEKNFRIEYESLNETINKANEKEYLFVEIPEDNVVKYSSYEELFLVIEQGSGVVFLCNNRDPYCRSVVSTLMDAVKETMYDTVYYLDISDDREQLTVKDNRLVVTKKSTKNYNKLVKLLDQYLDYYLIYDSEGNSIDTNVKRIEYPLVLFIKDGEIKSSVGWIFDNTNAYEGLNDRDKGTLLLEYINGINMINGSVIDEKE